MRTSSGPRILAALGALMATAACATASLAGTTWRATTLHDSRETPASLVPDTEITLAFDAEGRVAGTAGCNRYSAGYVADGETLRFERAALTRMACLRPGVMEQEQAFVDALASVASARVEGDRLELRRADGTLAVTAQRATSGE